MIQFNIPYPMEDDTAYHFSVGQLIRKYGILQDFPWTPFSLQYGHYADKELVFHLLFVPLGSLGFVTASRIVGAAGGAAILSALYLILRSEKVRLAGVWALMAVASSAFLFRFAQVRPHLLSVVLSLVFMWAYVRGRLRILGFSAFLYPLTYVAFWQIPLILAVAAESAHYLSGGPFRRKPAVTVIAAIAAGVLIHPNTLNLLRINWIHMYDILFQNAWGEKKVVTNLASEFDPFPVGMWARYLILTVVFTGTAMVAGWKKRRISPVPLGFAIAAVMFGLLTVKSNRFMEYFVPFSVASLALSTGTTARRFVPPILLGLSLLYSVAFGTDVYKNLISMETKWTYIEPAVAASFEQLIPEGSRVFTCGWDYTGSLMLALPERRFIVALDPTLFYKKDAYLYGKWSRMAALEPEEMAGDIRSLFRSRYVICNNDMNYARLFDALSSEPGVRTLLVHPRWVLFDLGENRQGDVR